MHKFFIACWALAGLLAIGTVFRAETDRTEPPLFVVTEAAPLADAIRSRCELPEGTVVFIMREETGR